MKGRLCAVCGDARRRLIFRQEFSPIAGASLFDGYDVVVCEKCGFAFADDIPAQADFDAYYQSLSKYEYDQRDGAVSPYDLRRFEHILSEVGAHIAPSAHVLEIGCSTGRLLALLREHGHPNVLGLDPSPTCATTARRLYGIEVATGALADAPNLGRHFDFVLGIGLLEHIRDLGEALGTVRGILRPRGCFCVEVPNALEFARFKDSPFQEFSVEHVDFFTPSSLANLFRLHGFEPVATWETTRELSHGYFMPSALGVFRALDSPGAVEFEEDTEGEPALLRYIASSRAVEQRLLETVDRLVDSARPLLVWGVGTHTQRLLATSRLGAANILAFVDSNSKYRERTIAGRPIISPAQVTGRPEPILVSSLMFQREIATQIRDELRYPNELILLYED